MAEQEIDTIAPVSKDIDHTNKFAGDKEFTPSERYRTAADHIGIFKHDLRTVMLNEAMKNYTKGVENEIASSSLPTVQSVIAASGFRAPKRGGETNILDVTSKVGERFLLDVKRYMLVYERADLRREDVDIIAERLGRSDVPVGVFECIDIMRGRLEAPERDGVVGRLKDIFE